MLISKIKSFRNNFIFLVWILFQRHRPVTSFTSQSSLQRRSIYKQNTPCSNNRKPLTYLASSREASSPAQNKDQQYGFNNTAVNLTTTMYQILEVSPAATQPEIKRAYLRLAKQTHPDAIRFESSSNLNNTFGDSTTSSTTSFTEIAKAYKLLSNPLERKRYDRSLRAQEFTQQVDVMMGKFSQNAAPKVVRAFESIALPLLRRGAATTVATWNAAADGKAEDFGQFLSKAVKAGQKAGEVIDRLELLEKGEELLKRADEESSNVEKLRDELTNTTAKRIQLALQTPNSKLTSAEALDILDGFKTVDEVSLLDSMLLRHTISYEIEQLQTVENEYYRKSKSLQELEMGLEKSKKSVELANNNAIAALNAEERARRALKEAENLRILMDKELSSTKRTLKEVEDSYMMNKLDVDRATLSLMKRQERVRVSLKRKDDEVNKKKAINNNDGEAEFDVVNARITVEKLKKEEKFLRGESARLEEKAERLRSRAKKLIERSEALEKDENEAWETLKNELREVDGMMES